MFQKPFGWLRWVLPSSLLLVSWAIFRPLVNRAPENGRRMQCQSNLKQIAIAVRQYRGDYDEHFSSLETTEGWREAISPYIAKETIFHCPGVKGDPMPQSADYWFNARLSGQLFFSFGSVAHTLLSGDGYSGADPRVSLSQMPKSWLDDPNSPAKRHLDGSNFAFADGHVKWLRPEKVTQMKPSEGTVTFAVR